MTLKLDYVDFSKKKVSELFLKISCPFLQVTQLRNWPVQATRLLLNQIGQRGINDGRICLWCQGLSHESSNVWPENVQKVMMICKS